MVLTRQIVILKSNENSIDVKYDGVPLRGIRYLFVKSATIANTLYTVRAGVNDNIRVGNSGGTWYTVSLTEGNYNITTFLVELKTQLDSTGIGTFTCTYDDLTMRITIACTSNYRLDYSLTTASKLFGLDEDTSLATSITMRDTVNLSSTERLYMVSKSISALDNPAYVYDGSIWRNSQAILSIPIDVDHGDIISYTPESDNSSYRSYKSGVINSIDIAIQDDDGVQVDLNGGTWTLELIVYTEV